ncbi:MAG: M1 family aminopeptidase [Thermodesulfobacteriota bacterium]
MSPIICRPLQLILLFSGLMVLAAIMPDGVFTQTEGKAPLLTVRHHLKVTLEPKEHLLKAEDTITLPAGEGQEVVFMLHEGLNPVSLTPGVTFTEIADAHRAVPVTRYKIRFPQELRTFKIRYEGRIFHPLGTRGKDSTGGVTATTGYIGEQGVYLSGDSYWYPQIGQALVAFRLEATVPAGWDVVSQGARGVHKVDRNSRRVQWDSPEPQQEIFLVSGRFTEYGSKADSVSAMVFLRNPDQGLARKYLDLTHRFIALYERLIGPYPYPKFAAVENFWETGFGMPSFTLLGPKVMRFPFILYSSYPHEILHNWWGNCVYVPRESGNWTEGLTAYLSDYLFAEQRGAGMEYRQETLQKYLDYVTSEKDFPLSNFRSRHDSPSAAVGYGKALMFFHMLRLQLGDDAFREGLQEFYRKNKFRFASYDDLRMSFEAVSGKSLREDFRQWVDRTGAPELRAKFVSVHGPSSEGYEITLLLEQVQPGKAYQLRVPVAVTLEGETYAEEVLVEMKGKRLEHKFKVAHRPLRIDVDPQFDLFRRLDLAETPPALSRAFGAKRVTFVLPSSAGPTLQAAYRELADSWSQAGPESVDVLLDTEIQTLPRDRQVVVVGWENRFVPDVVNALQRYQVTADKSQARIGPSEIPMKDHSVALVGDNPSNRALTLTWVAGDPPTAIRGLGRKLPHYSKYSYLAFKGEELVNILKGRWPVKDSLMTIFVPDGQGNLRQVDMGRLPPRKALVE